MGRRPGGLLVVRIDGQRTRRERWRSRLQLRAGIRFGVELVDVELRQPRFQLRIFRVHLRLRLVRLGLELRIVILWFGPSRRGQLGYRGGRDGRLLDPLPGGG
jgi:hypothetical protein